MNEKSTSPQSAGMAIIIKKYANRRLYNTDSSSYITLDDLAEMVKKGIIFTVYDAKTNEDITGAVLTQIMLEAESRGPSLLPLDFLRQLIRFYGDNVQSFIPTYLEMSFGAFAKNRDFFVDQLKKNNAQGQANNPALQYFNQMINNNIDFYRQMLSLPPPARDASNANETSHHETNQSNEMNQIKTQLAILHKKIEAMEHPGKSAPQNTNAQPGKNRKK